MYHVKVEHLITDWLFNGSISWLYIKTNRKPILQLKNENYQFSTRNWVRHEHVDSFTGSKLSLTQNQAKPSYANSFSFPGKIIKERVFRSYWITRLRTDLKPIMWSSNLDRKNSSMLFGTVVNEVLMINWISKIVWAFQKLSAFCLSYFRQSERHYLPDFSQRTVVPALCFLYTFMIINFIHWV